MISMIDSLGSVNAGSLVNATNSALIVAVPLIFTASSGTIALSLEPIISTVKFSAFSI